MIKQQEEFFDLSSLIVLDVETDGLEEYKQVHFVVTTDMEGNERVFEKPTTKVSSALALQQHLAEYRTIVGHNIIGFDLRVLRRLLSDMVRVDHRFLDTLVVSRLLNYGIKGGHSLESWGERVGVKKRHTGITDWSVATPEMLERCISDVRVNKATLQKMWRFLEDPEWHQAILIEHYVADMCQRMHETGLPFDLEKAKGLYERLSSTLEPMDEEIQNAFPPRLEHFRRVEPKVTRAGTLGSAQFRFLEKEGPYLIRQGQEEFTLEGGFEHPDLSRFSAEPFDVFIWEPFNPGSPRQMVVRLNEAGWKPTEKTKGHTEALKNRKDVSKEKLDEYAEFGWKVSEENLKTLPESAPEAAKTLAKRLTVASRISDLEEWIPLVRNNGRIHPRFQSIGSWPHRLSHSKPNSANVPVAKRSPKDTQFERFVNDVNDEMRALFIAGEGKRLVGTDADGIQMRIFAHLVGDERLIKALVDGRKEDSTDIHSLHRGALGDVCKSRDAAKTFIYAFLLGAGVAKVAEILETSFAEGKKAVNSFLEFYPGLKELKQSVIPRDASRGYFNGLDGRKVACDSEHLMLAGYLQNGEKVIMSYAAREWERMLKEEDIDYELLNWVHDEWQTLIEDNNDTAKRVGDIQIQAIRDQGDNLGMRCPLEGSTSFHANDNGELFYGGYSWMETH